MATLGDRPTSTSMRRAEQSQHLLRSNETNSCSLIQVLILDGQKWCLFSIQQSIHDSYKTSPSSLALDYPGLHILLLLHILLQKEKNKKKKTPPKSSSIEISIYPASKPAQTEKVAYFQVLSRTDEQKIDIGGVRLPVAQMRIELWWYVIGILCRFFNSESN